jgi:hypothetical protein
VAVNDSIGMSLDGGAHGDETLEWIGEGIHKRRGHAIGVIVEIELIS